MSALFSKECSLPLGQRAAARRYLRGRKRERGMPGGALVCVYREARDYSLTYRDVYVNGGDREKWIVHCRCGCARVLDIYYVNVGRIRRA